MGSVQHNTTIMNKQLSQNLFVNVILKCGWYSISGKILVENIGLAQRERRNVRTISASRRVFPSPATWSGRHWEVVSRQYREETTFSFQVVNKCNNRQE